MALMHNKFEERPEVIFIAYEDIIKTANPFLLNKIDKHLKSFYEPFIHVEKFEGYDMGKLSRFCAQQTDKNIFRALAKTEDFDVEGAYKELKDRYFEVYEQSPLLVIGDSVAMMASQKFTQKIYIYTEEYDVRVHLDIQKSFNDMSLINYVHGDFRELLDLMEPVTTYILNDLDYLYDIFDLKKAEYANIMMASYAYNYVLNDETDELEFRVDVSDIIGEAVCKFATFSAVELKAKDFDNGQEEDM